MTWDRNIKLLSLPTRNFIVVKNDETYKITLRKHYFKKKVNTLSFIRKKH